MLLSPIEIDKLNNKISCKIPIQIAGNCILINFAKNFSKERVFRELYRFPNLLKIRYWCIPCWGTSRSWKNVETIKNVMVQ